MLFPILLATEIESAGLTLSGLLLFALAWGVGKKRPRRIRVSRDPRSGRC